MGLATTFGSIIQPLRHFRLPAISHRPSRVIDLMSILNDLSEQSTNMSDSDDSDDFQTILDRITDLVNLIGYKTLDSRLFDLKTSELEGSSGSLFKAQWLRF